MQEKSSITQSSIDFEISSEPSYHRVLFVVIANITTT